MKKMIAAGLMMISLGVAALAEPTPTAQPAPAPVATSTAPVAQQQPQVKKDQTPAQPTQEKKPVELNFRSF